MLSLDAALCGICSLALLVTNGGATAGARVSQPASEPTLLRIESRTQILAAGSRESLRAVEESNGRRTAVAATWESTDPGVATIDSRTGEVAALSPGRVSIRAAYRGREAVAAFAVVPDVAGGWRGRFRVAGCSRASGEGPSPCRFNVGQIHPVTLEVEQRDQALSGAISMLDAPLRQEGEFSGTVNEQSILRLEAETEVNQLRLRIRDWSSTATISTGASLSGRFNMRVEFTNVAGPQVLDWACELLDFRRGSGSPLGRGRRSGGTGGRGGGS